MLAEVDAARAAIDSLGQTVRGDVRLGIPTGLGEFYLGARLLDFQRRGYPPAAPRARSRMKSMKVRVVRVCWRFGM